MCAQYDSQAEQWTTLSPPLIRHKGGAAMLLKGKIILAGGWDDECKLSDEIESYDPDTDTWTVLPVPLPVPLTSHCMLPLY